MSREVEIEVAGNRIEIHLDNVTGKKKRIWNRTSVLVSREEFALILVKGIDALSKMDVPEVE